MFFKRKKRINFTNNLIIEKLKKVVMNDARRKMMKIIFILILIIGNNLFCKAQENIFKMEKEFSWDKYEIKVSDNFRMAEIDKISNQLISRLKTYKDFEEYKYNFHFFDYDQDQELEIIFVGSGLSEGEISLFFKKENDRYVLKYQYFGRIVGIWNDFPTDAYNFTLRQVPSGMGDVNTYEIYKLVMENNSLKLLLSSKYAYYSNTNIPEEYMNPKYFEVVQDSYNLRLNPFIDDTIGESEYEINGNVVARYGKGAIGCAIAEKTDETGRIWWFVIMYNKAYPDFDLLYNVNNNNDYKYYSVGWMSSRYLKAIK